MELEQLPPELIDKAHELAFARREGVLAAELPRAEVMHGTEVAYALQAEAAREYGQPVKGWKIGATDPLVRQSLGATGPFYGPLVADALHESGVTLDLPAGLRGVEVEVGLRLARDLPASGRPYTAEAVADAVSEVFALIEVAAWRQHVQPSPEVGLAIADFGLNHAVVLGQPAEDWSADGLTRLGAECVVNGTVAGSGQSADLLFDEGRGPLAALAWLANSGPGLKAGEVIATGTLTGMLPVKPDDAVEGRLTGCDTVRLVCGEALGHAG